MKITHPGSGLDQEKKIKFKQTRLDVDKTVKKFFVRDKTTMCQDPKFCTSPRVSAPLVSRPRQVQDFFHSLQWQLDFIS